MDEGLRVFEAITTAAVLLALFGLALLACSQERHARSLGIPLNSRVRRRRLGWSALLLAFAALVWGEGLSFAAVWATVLVAALAPLITVALVWRPEILRIVVWQRRTRLARELTVDQVVQQ
ncbi:DUF3325 family protein [Leptolyngbya sp. 15MV]|nr:DUF3325 family protein [Leptolyngbya sp. 15MV]